MLKPAITTRRVAFLMTVLGVACTEPSNDTRGAEQAPAPVPGSAPTPPAGGQTPDCTFHPPTPAESARHYEQAYDFSTDWFTPHIPSWREAVGGLGGRPDVHYLEVGVFEGRSALWMLENVLTHPTSTLTGIDVFPGDLESTWRRNVELSGAADQVTTVKGYSQEVMRSLPLESYDVIYIDGSHKGPDVLTDAVLGWGLLEEGGVMIFDDYRWRKGLREPPELRPGQAIDAFITMFRDGLRVRHRCYQLIVQKTGNPCEGREHCTPFGPYVYDWTRRRLVDPAEGEVVRLQEGDAGVIEQVIRSRRFGYTEFEVPEELAASPRLAELRHRLELDFLR